MPHEPGAQGRQNVHALARRHEVRRAWDNAAQRVAGSHPKLVVDGHAAAGHLDNPLYRCIGRKAGPPDRTAAFGAVVASRLLVRPLRATAEPSVGRSGRKFYGRSVRVASVNNASSGGYNRQTTRPQHHQDAAGCTGRFFCPPATRGQREERVSEVRAPLCLRLRAARMGPGAQIALLL